MSTINNMFQQLSIRNKIVLIFGSVFIIGFTLNFMVTSQKLQDEAIKATVLEAQELTSALEKIRNGMGYMFSNGFYNMDVLLEDSDKLFLAVPVVRSLLVGKELAANSEYSFKAPSFNPRNPENKPTEFEAKLLRKLEAEKLATIWKIDEQANQLHFLRAIKLDETCMGCHGILEESLTGTLTDPLGYKMEGWRPGDYHGAFELIMPLDHIDAAVKSAALMSGGLIATIIVLGIALLYFLVNLILLRPINSTIDLLRDIDEGEGDLTKRLNISSKDEIGTMAGLFDSFIVKTQVLIKNIAASSKEVDSAAEQISTASEQLAAGSEEQQAQLSEVATTMEEMSAMILQASNNADDTKNQVQLNGEVANEGRDLVAKTVTGFEAVAETVSETSRQIDELSRRSEEIGNVIQVIDDIADQTNLLALNANIEAARAGDAGRGFAVVADEVRKLAERTVNATAEISQMIEAVQGDIGNAVKSMKTTQDQSKAGLELVAEADRSLEQIAGGIGSVVSAVQQIATASNEQSSGAEEISKNIEGVSMVAKESAHSAQLLATSAEQLNNEVSGLNQLIGQFKVE